MTWDFGKTIQLLAVVLDYVQNTTNPKPTIVVCPSSLSLNWQNEIKKFTKDLSSIVIHGNAGERKRQIKSSVSSDALLIFIIIYFP